MREDSWRKGAGGKTKKGVVAVAVLVLVLLTLEQRERHGEEQRPGADFVLRHQPVGRRVELAPEVVDHLQVQSGHDEDEDDGEIRFTGFCNKDNHNDNVSPLLNVTLTLIIFYFSVLTLVHKETVFLSCPLLLL